MILDSIAEVAVLGTAKRGLDQAQKEWCQSWNISLEKSEQAILQAAYLDAEMNIVGTILESEETGKEVPVIDPEENEIDESFVIYIETMLEDYSQLVNQYITLVLDENKVLPKHFIPRYLDYIRMWEPSTRQQAALITGERGPYLAQFTKRWNFLLPTTIDWETASHKQRLHYAKKLRESDPEKARELILLGYKQNHRTERQDLLEAININLSKDDATFLKENLKDRSAVVRQAAYTMLATIDEDTQKELCEAAATSLQLTKGGLLKSSKLEVVLPEDSDLIKQLPTAHRANVQVGKKAEKLLNLISLVPLSFYELSPDKVLELFAKNDWNKVLLRALQNAVILHQDKEWALHLIPCLQNHELTLDKELLALLLTEDFNKLFKDQLKQHAGQFNYSQPLGRLLKDSYQTIDVANSKTGLKELARFYETNHKQTRNLYSEDLKVIKSFLSRVDWSVQEIPDALEDFRDLFITKQKLKDSLR